MERVHEPGNNGGEQDRQGEPAVPQAGWRPLVIPQDTRAWTDDFSDLLSVQTWR